jgi:hypothetical protein
VLSIAGASDGLSRVPRMVYRGIPCVLPWEPRAVYRGIPRVLPWEPRAVYRGTAGGRQTRGSGWKGGRDFVSSSFFLVVEII